MFSAKRLWSGVALAALSFSTAGVAHAQSTASQIQEDEIIVTARHDTSANGLGTQVNDAKDVSIVTQQYFRTQIGSSNFGQLINLLPGISYSSEDYTGVLSGDFRMHGFDGNHVSVLIDGSPVNDTGNYAVFPGEYLPSEVTARTTVNIGATDVDSPTASAVGGTVNIVSVLPSDHPGVRASFSGGSYDLQHIFAQIDTGPVGPFGTTSYISMNYTDADKWKGEGDVERFGLDGRIYQPLHGDDFMSVAFTWASDRPYFYQSGSRAQLATIGDDFDYNPSWVRPTAINGTADGLAFGTGAYSGINSTNYWALHPNPVDFGDIRGQSRFSLRDNVTLTVDPSFFYTLANGGGSTAISECDTRLRGSSTTTVGAAGTCTTQNPGSPLPGNGVDLNGDGDVKDVVAVYTPNNTNTYRWGLNASLLWDLNAQNHLQFAYTLDYGLHRQTGEYSPINPTDGEPSDVFGGRDGVGITTTDGLAMVGRDRQSIAELNQFSANYLGEFMDDRLHVNIGVRDPYFQRNLDQRCYTYNGTSALCDSIDPALVLAAYNTDVTNHNANALNNLFHIANSAGTGQTLIAFNSAAGTPNFRFPFQETVNYNQLLPNAGVSYRVGDNHLFYLSYAQGFSAPKTDDLYASTTENVAPETSTMYGAGYRYQGTDFSLSFNLWRSDYQNRIVQSFDPNDPSLSIDRNVGDVRLQGVDIEGTWRPVENFTLYGSATFQDSEVLSNVFAASVGGVAIALPTRGKQLVMTPEQEFSARAQYDFGFMTFGVQAKYQGRRFISDMNDDSIGAFTVVDMDANFPLRFVNDHTSLQLNVLNLFDEDYITRSNNASNFHPVTVGGTTVSAQSGPFLFLGAPRTVTVTLRTQF